MVRINWLIISESEYLSMKGTNARFTAISWKTIPSIFYNWNLDGYSLEWWSLLVHIEIHLLVGEYRSELRQYHEEILLEEIVDEWERRKGDFQRPFSLFLSVQTSSRQMPRSYSASKSKKHERISVDCSKRIRSLALRYNRTCVAKLSTIVPVQKSSQSISRNLNRILEEKSFHLNDEPFH